MQALDAGKAGVPRPDALSVQALPAQAISQRADVASLERELAASSAEIGAAEAALYPSLSLSGSIGRSSTSGIAFTPWSFGPTLDLAVFDAGKRRANVDSAKASYDSALASYRQGVRTAVKEVEQALVNLDAAARRAQETARAADEYRKYVQALDAGWHAGTNSLLELEEGRRSAIAAEVEAITLQQDQVSDWIALYKALGGGGDEAVRDGEAVQRGAPWAMRVSCSVADDAMGAVAGVPGFQPPPPWPPSWPVAAAARPPQPARTPRPVRRARAR